jgi:tetratricopeptide (TPR) repeat protein
MGFGIKTDFATGRKLDLNKSYRLLIKPVVESSGLVCIRADEIRHSGTIDLPMYQELLKADVVIADLSTANVNAFYELGIRHALRPRTTIVISEDKLTYPFDLNHVKITSYTHLGDAIDFEEVERFRRILGDTLNAVLKEEQPDSPVYTFLNKLIPPSMQENVSRATEQLGNAIEEAIEDSDRRDTKNGKSKDTQSENQTLALLTEQAEAALKRKDYRPAKTLFESALFLGSKPEQQMVVNNPYLVQRLALSTYKSKDPDETTALKKAMALLSELDLAHTNDPETVSLAGAIEKKLFELGQGDKHLEDALLYFQRSFYLLHNRYNGINVAFLLTCLAHKAYETNTLDAIADLIYSNRTRVDVLSICDRDWKQIIERESKADHKVKSYDDDLLTDEESSDEEKKFWILVNKAEAYFGLGEFEKYKEAKAAAEKMPHEEWMMNSFREQLQFLGNVLKNIGHLLRPQWIHPGS